MTGRQLAKDAGVIGVITAIVVGAGLAALSIGGVVHERDRLRAQAAQAAPAPTVTVTQAGQAPPSPRASRPARKRPVVEAAPAARSSATGRSEDRAAGVPARGSGSGSGTGGSAGSGGSGDAGGSEPTPPAPQPDRCTGALSVRLPLGVLPNCLLTVGGSP